jgi:hypothetical protein
VSATQRFFEKDGVPDRGRRDTKGAVVVVEEVPTKSDTDADAPQRRGWLTRIGEDWWATLVAGVIVVLAVADALPKIPW